MIDVFIHFPDDLLQKHVKCLYGSMSLSFSYKFKDEIIEDMDLVEFGTYLWEIIKAYNDTSWILLDESINVVFISSNHEIHKIPWEITCHEKHGFLFLMKNIYCSRAFKKHKINKINKINKILHMATENSGLSLEMEKNAIGEICTQNSINIMYFDLKNDIKNTNADIVIISSHGEYYYEPHRSTSSKSYFIDEEEEVDFYFVYELINRVKPSLVLINSCESSKHRSSNIKDCVAYNISSMGVGFVGMREPILDVAAIGFTCEFLKNLIVNCNPIIAIHEARQSIILPMKNIYSDIRGKSSYGQWAIPEFYF